MGGTGDGEFEAWQLSHEVRGMFPSRGPGSAVAEAAVAAMLAAGPEGREAATELARDASAWVTHLGARLWRRDADLAPWHALEGMPFAEVAAHGSALRRGWAEARAAMTEDDLDREEREEWAADAERARVEELEEAGAYGRTLAHSPDVDRWIYVRFGRMPKDSRSVFGLAGGDTEDGPDAWRLESGNQTHEAGVCVLRAGHHPSVPDAYVVLQPEFSLARYQVDDFERYLNNIIPRFEDGEEPTVLRIDGFPLTCKARDGTLRLELGSDGEFLMNLTKPYETITLTLADVYVSADLSVEEFLRQRRGYEAPRPR